MSQLRKKEIKGWCVQKLFTWQAQALSSHSNRAKQFVLSNNIETKRGEGFTFLKSFENCIAEKWSHDIKAF